MPPQDTDTERVKRADFRPGSVFWWAFLAPLEELRRPFLHFTSRLAGKRHRQNSFWANSATNQLGDPHRDDTRLARPGPGQHEQGTAERTNRVELGRIERHGAIADFRLTISEYEGPDRKRLRIDSASDNPHSAIPSVRLRYSFHANDLALAPTGLFVMDSEHRHELEQNDLATWLSDKIEQTKPFLPAIAVGLVIFVAAVIGYKSWKASAREAKADRWRSFAVAVEGAQPDLNLLKQAAEANPDTNVGEWSEVTWADGRLYQATLQYFRNRDAANTALDEAVEVYERMITATEQAVAERAKFQLARAYELQGKLDEARDQYKRVTGAFAEVAQQRAEQLDSKAVKESYAWITATKSAPPTDDVPDLIPGDLTPDDITIPDEDADDTLQGLLDDVEEEVNANTEQPQTPEQPQATELQATELQATEQQETEQQETEQQETEDTKQPEENDEADEEAAPQQAEEESTNVE